MGPVRSVSGNSAKSASGSTPAPNSTRTPRPPNAWILYRMDKVQFLSQDAKPGEPRMPQADISKRISQMWRDETPEVKQHYERLSEIRKAEHLNKHPNYRFQPMKREDKERLKEEKRLEREKIKHDARKKKLAESRTAAASSSSANPAPPPPPVKASSSSYYRAHVLAQKPGTPGSQPPSPPTTTSLPPIRTPQPSAPSTLTNNSPLHDPSISNWLDGVDLNHSSIDPYGPDYLTFNLPSNMPTGDWDPAMPFGVSNVFAGMFDPSQPHHTSPSNTANISPTDDPSIFQLSDFDANNLLANPTGDIDVSFDPQGGFMGWDSIMNGTGSNSGDTWSNLFGNGNEGASNGFPDTLFPSEILQNVQPEQTTPPRRSPQGTPPHQRQQSPPSGYVPPAGAANTGRRVAGTWKYPGSPVQFPTSPQSPGRRQLSWGSVH